jgi:hypothetical protein
LAHAVCRVRAPAALGARPRFLGIMSPLRVPGRTRRRVPALLAGSARRHTESKIDCGPDTVRRGETGRVGPDPGHGRRARRRGGAVHGRNRGRPPEVGPRTDRSRILRRARRPRRRHGPLAAHTRGGTPHSASRHRARSGRPQLPAPWRCPSEQRLHPTTKRFPADAAPLRQRRDGRGHLRSRRRPPHHHDDDGTRRHRPPGDWKIVDGLAGLPLPTKIFQGVTAAGQTVPDAELSAKSAIAFPSAYQVETPADHQFAAPEAVTAVAGGRRPQMSRQATSGSGAARALPDPRTHRPLCPRHRPGQAGLPLPSPPLPDLVRHLADHAVSRADPDPQRHGGHHCRYR